MPPRTGSRRPRARARCWKATERRWSPSTREASPPRGGLPRRAPARDSRRRPGTGSIPPHPREPCARVMATNTNTPSPELTPNPLAIATPSKNVCRSNPAKAETVATGLTFPAGARCECAGRRVLHQVHDQVARQGHDSGRLTALPDGIRQQVGQRHGQHESGCHRHQQRQSGREPALADGDSRRADHVGRRCHDSGRQRRRCHVAVRPRRLTAASSASVSSGAGSKSRRPNFQLRVASTVRSSRPRPRRRYSHWSLRA